MNKENINALDLNLDKEMLALTTIQATLKALCESRANKRPQFSPSLPSSSPGRYPRDFSNPCASPINTVKGQLIQSPKSPAKTSGPYSTMGPGHS